VARRFVWLLSCAGFLFWLWLAFVGEWNPTEWVAGACAACVATVAAAVVRGQHELRFRWRVRWLRETVGIPLQIVLDFLLLVRALPSRDEGVFHARPTGPRGRTEEAAGRSAFLALAATFSPNAYVIAVDRESGEVLMHELVAARASEEPA
jgi:hypothetical protein